MPAPSEAVSLRRTPLFDVHRELGARLIDFGGWEMPVQYEGILAEHRAERERAASPCCTRLASAPSSRSKSAAAPPRAVETPFYRRKKEVFA